MRRLLAAAGALLALGVVDSNEASAGHHHHGRGHFHGGYSSPGFSISVGYGGYQGYNRTCSGYGGGYPVYSAPVYVAPVSPVWHNTTHLDYHGPSLVPHRGHFDYVPGHYDVHRSGHWHYGY